MRVALDPEREPNECRILSQGFLFHLHLPSLQAAASAARGCPGARVSIAGSGEVWGRGTGADPQPQHATEAPWPPVRKGVTPASATV